MECLAIMFFLFIAYIVLYLIAAIIDAATKGTRDEISRRESNLKKLESEIESKEKFIRMSVKHIFYDTVDYSVMKPCLDEYLKMFKFRVDDMEYENKCLKNVTRKKDYENIIGPYRDYTYPELKEIVCKFDGFTTKIRPFMLLMDEKKYGIIDEKRLSLIKTTEKTSAVQIIEKYRNLVLKDELS